MFGVLIRFCQFNFPRLLRPMQANCLGLWLVLGFALSGPSMLLAQANLKLQNHLKEALAQGFLDAKIKDSHLVKGFLYKIEQVQWNQIKALPQFTLSHFEGQPASSKVTTKIIDELKAALLGGGFVFSSIEFDLATGKNPYTVILLIQIKTGSRFKLGKVIFSGSKTTEQTLKRLSLLEWGETYNYRRLNQAIRKLSRTGYFSDVTQTSLTRDSLKNLIYPLVHLTDLKANQIAGVLGYNNEESVEGDKLNGFVDLELLNLGGTARDLEFHFAAQNQERQIQFDYREPWIGSLPIGASLFLNLFLQDSVYQETNLGTTLFQDINFNSRYILSFSRQFNESFFTQDTFFDFRDTLILSSKKSKALISGIEVSQDWRDKAPATLRGGFVKVKTNGIRREESDTTRFLMQNLAQIQVWLPLSGRIILKSGLAAAVSFPLKESLYNRGDLFYLGGVNTLRGYREREFLTNSYVYGNFELQYLLSSYNRAMLLLDPGLINKPVGEFYWNRVLGYGLGLDMGSKNWVFSIRYALNPERSFGNGLVQVKIENRF